MNKKLFHFLLLSALIVIWGTAVNAEIAYDEDGNYVNIDKFESSRKVKVKHSQLAEMMENGTRDMMNKQKSNSPKQRPNRFQKQPSELEKYKNASKQRSYVTFGGYRLF